ncbi:MAG: hypothetical protein WCJ30_09980, partial [Deltaproteobacteria bacterium]
MIVDTGTDVAADTAVDAAPDVAPDVTDAATDAPPADAPACTATYDEGGEFIAATNGVWVAEIDQVGLGLGASDLLAFASSSPLPPHILATSGACRLYEDFFGGAARASAVHANYGNLSFTQGTSTFHGLYDVTSHSYGVDLTGVILFPGTDATVMFPGLPDGPAGMGTARLPNRPVTPPAASLVAEISRTADTVFPFTPPAGYPSDGVVWLLVADLSNYTNYISCAV